MSKPWKRHPRLKIADRCRYCKHYRVTHSAKSGWAHLPTMGDCYLMYEDIIVYVHDDCYCNGFELR